MPAPTALKAAPEPAAADIPLPLQDQDEEMLLDAPASTDAAAEATTAESAEMEVQQQDAVDEEGRPRFARAKNTAEVRRSEQRKVQIPAHRMTPLKAAWPQIYLPLVEHLKLQCRMNMHRKCVELRTSKSTTDNGAIQKGADFVRCNLAWRDLERHGRVYPAVVLDSLLTVTIPRSTHLPSASTLRTQWHCSDWTTCISKVSRSKTSRP